MEGEKSVYAHEARGSAPINLPKTKTAFQLFAASFKESCNGISGRDFASLQKATAASWRALLQSEREPFHALAATQAKEREKKLQSLRHQQQQEMLGQQLQRKHVLKKKLKRPRGITGGYQKLVFDIIFSAPKEGASLPYIHQKSKTSKKNANPKYVGIFHCRFLLTSILSHVFPHRLVTKAVNALVVAGHIKPSKGYKL